MTEEELYNEYAAWTGQLHHWMLKHGNRHLDVEFFPAPQWVIKLYTGHAEDTIMTGWFGTTVPSFSRPEEETRAVIPLPRPEAEPTRAELDETFRELCLSAARILEIDIGKPKLHGTG